MSKTNTFIGPDFLVIGAQRGGTTSVHHVLSNHPQAWVPPLKELHYFDYFDSDSPYYRNDIRYTKHLKTLLSQAKNSQLKEVSWYLYYFLGKRNDSWYFNLFERAKKAGFIVGEVTPGYSHLSTSTYLRIKSKSPNIKLIYILRDPIDRIWSNLVRRIVRDKNRVFADVSIQEFETDLQEYGESNYFLYSSYSKAVKRLESIFSNNILYLFYDDLCTEPAIFYETLCSFLNISLNKKAFQILEKPLNLASKGKPIPDKIYQILLYRMKDELLWLKKRFPASPPETWIKKHQNI